jgi:hypothetical protein
VTANSDSKHRQQTATANSDNEQRQRTATANSDSEQRQLKIFYFSIQYCLPEQNLSIKTSWSDLRKLWDGLSTLSSQLVMSPEPTI